MTATLPYSWYTDPEILAAERARLFASAWHYAGHLGLVAEPGSYFTCRAGEVPIVVVRDRSGELRALVNVCRHRGAEVVSGAGPCTTLQCHYHAWTYGLDGALRAAPRADDDLDRAALSLRPAAIDTWGPFVFVHASDDPPPLADTLGELPDIVARGGLDVDALVFHHRAEYTLEANWKVAVENYLECYHCAVAHPGFSDVIDVDQEAYGLESHPTFASHYARVREQPRGAHYDAAGIDGQFHLVWPSLKVNVMPGRPNLSLGPLTPVAPGRTEGVLDYFFAPGEDPAWIADYLELDEQVGVEDGSLVESVQRGMASGVLAHGELMLPSEGLIAAFQRWVADGLQTPSRGKVSVQERDRIGSSPS
ncbi:MAG TPA: aromatic ring-hydroxylating dioxygenase subunit alpha [Solirubrobacteraceae bacterium]